MEAVVGFLLCCPKLNNEEKKNELKGKIKA